MRILNVESSYAVRYLIPAGSVEKFYLLFPDPWPKRRHHRRRIVTGDFINSIYGALANHSVLSIATDQLDYFSQIERVARDHFGFAVADPAASSDRTDLPLTKFERRFRQASVAIYRLELRKTSPVPNALARQPSASNSISTAPVAS